jgi:hypothetical protein
VLKYRHKVEKQMGEADWPSIEFEVKKRIVAHSKELDTSKTWLHVDMDMFYAAVS